MKLKGLRIGNLAQDQDGNMLKVIGLQTDPELVNEDIISFYVIDRTKFPLKNGWKAEFIKLTPDFFEKNGYERGETQKRFGNGYDYKPEDVFTEWFDFKINDNVIYRFSNWHYSGGVDNQDCLIWHDNEIRGCDFVHDFQNLFYALEGYDILFTNN